MAHFLFCIAALKNQDVLIPDVTNSYINASCHDSTWKVTFPDFTIKQGCVVLIVHYIYGLKSITNA